MANQTEGVTNTGGVKFDFHTGGNEPVRLSGNFLLTPTTIALSTAVIQHDRIDSRKNVLNGEPFIRGTRVPIFAILDGLEEGLSPEVKWTPLSRHNLGQS